MPQENREWLEQTLSKVLVIGMSLSSEKDTMKLLDRIVSGSMELTGADAGTLYLAVDKDSRQLGAVDSESRDRMLLEFAIARNASMQVPFRSSWSPLSENSLSGYAILSGESLRIEDAREIPADRPYRHNRAFDDMTGYRTRSMLTVPMSDHEGKRIGVLQLINKKADAGATLDFSDPATPDRILPFTPFDEQLISSIASQAAVAIENAILERDLKALLEDYRRQNEELLRLGQRILGAHEEERKRIARDLHDGPAQSVSNLAMKLEICRRIGQMGDSVRLDGELGKLGEAIRNSVKEIRTILYDLKPSVLEHGLFRAIRTRLGAFEESTGVKPDLGTVGDDAQLPEYVVSAVYGIVQESLNNIAKYAHATRVSVILSIDGSQLKLHVTDDGAGFDPAAQKEISSERRLSGGFGLQGMRERVELLRGTLSVDSAPGAGTRIYVTVPL